MRNDFCRIMILIQVRSLRAFTSERKVKEGSKEKKTNELNQENIKELSE